MKRVRPERWFSLRYTDSAHAQLMELPFELLSRVERELERICREQDPGEDSCATEELPSRYRYEIGPVHAVAWLTRTEPELRLMTVVEVVFPDKPVPREAPPQKPSPASGKEKPKKALPVRTVYPRRPVQVPAEV